MKDKVAIITGASSGIGKALAYEMSSRGAIVILAARNGEALSQIVVDLKSKGLRAEAVRADVGIEEDCRKIIDFTVKEFGRIDILVNNAGISMRAMFDAVDLDVIRKLMQVNFWGTVYCTKYALPYLLAVKGSVTGISSVSGYKGLPGRTGYSASKAAIQGFLDSLRVENLHKGLHVLIACPGFTASNIRFTALNASGSAQGESPRDENEMMTAEEVARKIANAIEKRKKFLILTFTGKLTVFLNKIFPSMMDQVVFNHMAKEPDSPFK